MKRSEMIEKVATDLQHLAANYPNMSLDVTNKEVLNTVLSLMESHGMTPPRLDEDKVQAILSIYYGGHSTHKWDEEFEKDDKALEAYNCRMARLKDRKKKGE